MKIIHAMDDFHADAEGNDEIASRPGLEGGEWGELPARLRTLFSSRAFLRILVAEDNHFNRLLLVDLLQARGAPGGGRFLVQPFPYTAQLFPYTMNLFGTYRRTLSSS